jgi:hypothetical protein
LLDINNLHDFGLNWTGYFKHNITADLTPVKSCLRYSR